MISISHVHKVYNNGFEALKNVSLEVEPGEIFALLGPNGAGKTSLIHSVCGIVQVSSGTIRVDGHDIVKDYKHTRRLIGLVPQELTTNTFESPWETATFSRGLFGKAANPAHIEQTLKELSLWDKRDSRIVSLSGGMKRRVMIAKALAHEPKVLFLDEPTAGVDVDLRQDMWEKVRALRDSGVTIILTTHYLEEAEELADRIGVMHKGELILKENTQALLQQMGSKQLVLDLSTPMNTLPRALAPYKLKLEAEGTRLVYSYQTSSKGQGIAEVLQAIHVAGIPYNDVQVSQSSLEDIFVQLVRNS